MRSSRASLFFALAVVLISLGLRLHRIGDLSLWTDETDFFNEAVYEKPGKGLLEFALHTKSTTTNTAGWPALIWIASRATSRTVTAARSLSALLGSLTAGILFLFVLRLTSDLPAPAPLAAAVAAALLCAVSIVQIDFSQRTYAYGGVAFLATLQLVAHRILSRVLHAADGNFRRLLGAGVLWILLGALGLAIHASLALLTAASGLFLALPAWRSLRILPPAKRTRLVLILGACLLVLAVSFVVNGKNPRYGFRVYLPDYYSSPGLGAVGFAASRFHDLLTYHLNLYFDTRLYMPRALNPVLVPLVAAAVLGWILAARRCFGKAARELAFLTAVAVALVFALSLASYFPFGGVRQTLFLSPMIFAFAGLGIARMAASAGGRWFVVAVAVCYLATWAWRLPVFYRERVSVYGERDLVAAWEKAGRVPILADGGAAPGIRYVLRERPGIPVARLDTNPPASFLLISPHWPLEKSIWSPKIVETLTQAGFKIELLASTPSRYGFSLNYITSIYFPPNEFWAYRVTRTR